jgi:tetratricopeptide (TPR) repeat protein
MSYCWKCGAETQGNLFICPDCQRTAEQTAAQERAISTAAGEITSEISKQTGMLASEIESLTQVQIRTAEAIEDLTRIVDYRLAEVSWSIKQQTVVLVGILKAISEPNRVKAEELRKIGEELRKLGRFEESIKRFKEAEELNPLDYRIYVGWGFTYVFNNELDKGIKCFEKSLKTEVSNLHKSDAHLYIARTYYSQGKFHEALEHARKALELSPEYAEAYYRCAHYSALVGENKKALEFLKEAVVRNEDYIEMARKEKDFGYE